MSDRQFKVRHAVFHDAGAIVRMVRAHPDELVPRSISDILQNIDRFYVAEADDAIVGVVSWSILPNSVPPSIRRSK